MTRQSVLKIKAEITIPYDRKRFGETATAEKHCEGIKEAITRTLADATLTRWEPEHTTIEAPPPAPAKK